MVTTGKLTNGAVKFWLNSELSPDSEVAVTVMNWPGVVATGSSRLMLARPVPSVPTVAEPR